MRACVRPFFLLVVTLASLHVARAQFGGTPGAFSRLGFGARGIGMGNAMTAVARGDIVGYYNPALLPFAGYRHAGGTFGVLSLDRALNFLGYSQPVQPSAGVSVGIINAGVSEIDGRDSDGRQTGPLKTSENEFLFGFANRFPAGFAIGLNVKFYLHHLYTDVTATSIGIDVGVFVPVGSSLSLGVTVRDINAKYKWDTGELYGRDGKTTEDKFPLLYTIGAAYQLPDSLALVSLDLEASNASTLILRGGVEVPLMPELTVRGGIDRVDLKEKGAGVRPSLGFSLRRSLGEWEPAVHYAFIAEPFSGSAIHLISVSAIF